MDAARIAVFRAVLDSTGWVEHTREFARCLRTTTQFRGGLLLVGTPGEEPWHLAAHLDDESRFAGLPELSPTLVRWNPPSGAPAHLSVGMSRLEVARRGETVFVVAPDAAPADLLERVADARRTGATVLALGTGDAQLEDVAHEALTVPPSGLLVPQLSSPALSFDVVQHLVSAAAGEPDGNRQARRGFRYRLARLLDIISGPPPQATR